MLERIVYYAIIYALMDWDLIQVGQVGMKCGRNVQSTLFSLKV
jgi:hypothetical protein